jgi:predicted DNA-binding transcriptional regulator AlpA
MMEQYLVTDEVAEMCRTSPNTVRFWRHVGKGPRSFKLGRRVLYAKGDVESWIKELQRADASTGTPEVTK